MNWEEILTNVILSVLGIVLSALGTYITYFINKKIKDEKLKGIIQSLNKLVQDAVLETYQTYVQALKDKNMFDEKAQKEALSRCLATIKANMTTEVAEWLKSNHSDIDGYLRSLIEAQIALLKR